MGRIWGVKSNQLTARKVETATEPGYYGDGGGLYLQVSKKYGSRNWVFRFMLNGHAREMGLGSPRTFTLKEARERARQCRQLVADGFDPIEERRRRRDDARAETSGRMLFKDAVVKFLEVHQNTWKNAKHKQQWANTLRDYAKPLRDRPTSAIDGAQITDALASIWTKKPETARRVKQRIERVCQWVKDGMPLPFQGASKRVRHHPALSFAELPSFMSKLRKRDSISARALEFTILTAARTGEAIGAKWSEFDLDAGVWTIPAWSALRGRHWCSKEAENLSWTWRINDAEEN